MGLRKRVFKWIIALMVTAGLFLSTRSAIDHWNQQHTAIFAQLQDLDKQIEQEPDADRRTALRITRQQTEKQLPSWSNVRWSRMTLGGVLYLLALLPSVVVLQINCHRLGQTPRLSTAALAQLMGHLGKYIPGKAMVVILRASILRRDGVPTLTATVSIFLETFMFMAVGAAIAGLVILPLDVPVWIKWMAITMAVGATLPTLPPVIQHLIGKYGSHIVSRAQLSINWNWFAQTWALSVLSWLLMGAAFATIVTAIPGSFDSVSDSLPISLQLYAISVASIGLAMVVGFASLIPGGAGVREFVLVTIMGLMINPTHSLLAAIATRLVFMGIEMLAALICWLQIRSLDSSLKK